MRWRANLLAIFGIAQLAFAFRITVQAVASGLVFAVVMGVCGGLLPALRGARLSIINALRGA